MRSPSSSLRSGSRNSRKPIRRTGDDFARRPCLHFSPGGGTVEDLINKVSEKAGINADQAKSAVNAVMEFIKNKVPGIGDQLKATLSGEGGGGIVDTIRKKIGV